MPTDQPPYANMLTKAYDDYVRANFDLADDATTSVVKLDATHPVKRHYSHQGPLWECTVDTKFYPGFSYPKVYAHVQGGTVWAALVDLDQDWHEGPVEVLAEVLGQDLHDLFANVHAAWVAASPLTIIVITEQGDLLS